MNILLFISNVIFQSSYWLLTLCVLVGLVYAVAFYYRDNSFGKQSKVLNKSLGLFRFLTVTIICLLLLSPVIKNITTETEPPIVVLAQDNSVSIGQVMDSEQRSKYQKDIESLRQKLAKDYDLKVYSLGADVKEGIDFSYIHLYCLYCQFL